MSESVRFDPVDRAALFEHELNAEGQITMSPRGTETTTEWITANEAVQLEDAR